MDRHLNELELNETLAGNTPAEIAQHLADCTICRGEYEQMAYPLRAVNEQTARLADRPEAFWRAQRTSIQKRVPAHRGFARMRIAFAAVAAIVIVGIALLLRSGTSVVPPPHQQFPKASSDQQLMVDVEQTLASNVSPAFEPTDALIGAMTQTPMKSSESVTKEKGNEN